MTARTLLRSRYALAGAGAVAAVAVAGIVAFALPGQSSQSPFSSLVPAPAPAGWPHATLPNGTAVLSYPPSMQRTESDKDALSAARMGPDDSFELYLNATPRQGDEENLRDWAQFRVRLLREDDATSAHEVASAQGVRFRGGTGSCVIDQYVTKIGGHHFEETACLVQGRTSASVIVATAPTAAWAQARPLLMQAVAAYLVH
ncbi:MAG TPA: hypothetical protein VGS19_22130 [Streptosporangiaceae bacterium]|nr:hypothetical protein [Streptosporangiaceae bacterium]